MDAKFWQQREANRMLYAKMAEKVCLRYDLTPAELNILLFLANHPEVDSAVQVVNLCGISKSHVSKSLRTLQDRKLVSAEYRQDNRRTLHLRLLEDAAPIVQDGQQAQKEFAGVLLQGFSKEEKRQMTDFLARILQNTRHYLEGSEQNEQ